jgi:hypothetical protein
MSPLRSYIINPDIEVPSSSHCIINSKVKMSTSDSCYRLQLRIQIVWDVFSLSQNLRPLLSQRPLFQLCFHPSSFILKLLSGGANSVLLKSFFTYNLLYSVHHTYHFSEHRRCSSDLNTIQNVEKHTILWYEYIVVYEV